MLCYDVHDQYTTTHCWPKAGLLVNNYDRPSTHRSYLLTVWEERSTESDTPSAWRFRLEEARTGQRRGFASLEALIVFLQAELFDDRTELSDRDRVPME
jgi:hypothetical protein